MDEGTGQALYVQDLAVAVLWPDKLMLYIPGTNSVEWVESFMN